MKNTYDTLIKTAAGHYLPGVDWRLVKAQLYQESMLNPKAVSPVGAKGLAQFMPATWADMIKPLEMPADASPFDPDYAIPACCYYMKQLHQKWSSPRPEADRYALALASYNAGFGNLINAQKKAGGAFDYQTIAGHLHYVTGQGNASETRTYVRRIFGYFTSQILGEA
jgi:soluble lytic murein transglycosylase-like protein